MAHRQMMVAKGQSSLSTVGFVNVSLLGVQFLLSVGPLCEQLKLEGLLFSGNKMDLKQSYAFANLLHSKNTRLKSLTFTNTEIQSLEFMRQIDC